MAMERLPKRRRCNTYYPAEEKNLCERYNGITEVMRLERKKAIYIKQEIALKMMQKVIEEQLIKLEVEGLQIAANVREKDEKYFGITLDETIKSENKEETPFSEETANIDDAEEINKYKLDLDRCLEDMLYNKYCPESVEDDEEDGENFNYFR